MDTKGRKLFRYIAGILTAVVLMGSAYATTAMASGIGMIDTAELLDIHAEASDSSAVVGQVMDEGHVAILERADGWVQIKAGDIIGWVPQDNLIETEISNEEAYEANEKIVAEYAEDVEDAIEALSEEEALNDADEAADTEDSAEAGEEDENTEEDVEQEQIVAEAFSKDHETEKTEGNSAAEQTKAAEEAQKLAEEQEKAAAEEQAKAAEEAQKRAEEQAKAVAEAQKLAEEQAKAVAEAQRLAEEQAKAVAEAQRLAEEQAKAVAEAQQAAQQAVSADDLELLASIIYCEAKGEPYIGKVAVGSVVLNRVKSDRYPDTIREVIYAKGQFSPVRNGSMAKALKNGSADESCYMAALEALAGSNPVGEKTSFRRVNGRSGQVIGHHVFY